MITLYVAKCYNYEKNQIAEVKWEITKKAAVLDKKI